MGFIKYFSIIIPTILAVLSNIMWEGFLVIFKLSQVYIPFITFVLFTILFLVEYFIYYKKTINIKKTISLRII